MKRERSRKPVGWATAEPGLRCCGGGHLLPTAPPRVPCLGTCFTCWTLFQKSYCCAVFLVEGSVVGTHAGWFEPNHRFFCWLLVEFKERRLLVSRNPKENTQIWSGNHLGMENTCRPREVALRMVQWEGTAYLWHLSTSSKQVPPLFFPDIFKQRKTIPPRAALPLKLWPATRAFPFCCFPGQEGLFPKFHQVKCP